MPTDFAPTLIATRRLIELYGLDPKPIFKAHGIDLKLARDPNARFKIEVAVTGDNQPPAG